MKKAYRIAIVSSILLAAIYIFRTELLFRFQIARLRHLKCYSAGYPPCKNKIWAHRVNSIERLQLLNGYFTGIEADVVYDGTAKNFLVYHPPFNNHALSIERFLSELQKQEQKAWLDLRYVDSINYKDAYHMLLALDEKLHYHQSIIFELYDVKAANYFAEKGLATAINVPVALLNNDAEWRTFSNTVSKGVKYVSQEDLHIPLIKQYFPDKKIITWSPSFKNYFWTSRLEQLLNDEKVEIVLVNIKSRYRY